LHKVFGEKAFTKLIMIKSKNRSCLENIENVLRCPVSGYE